MAELLELADDLLGDLSYRIEELKPRLRRVPRRTVVLTCAAVFVLVLSVVWYTRHRGPSLLRLAPRSELVFYANTAGLHSSSALNVIAGLPLAPNFHDALAQAGFDYDQQLSEAAFSLGHGKHGNAEAVVLLKGDFPQSVRETLARGSIQPPPDREVPLELLSADGTHIDMAFVTPQLLAISTPESSGLLKAVVHRHRWAWLCDDPGVERLLAGGVRSDALAFLATNYEKLSNDNQTTFLGGSLPGTRTLLASVVPDRGDMATFQMSSDTISDDTAAHVYDSFEFFNAKLGYSRARRSRSSELEQFSKTVSLTQHNDRVHVQATAPLHTLNLLFAEGPDRAWR